MDKYNIFDERWGLFNWGSVADDYVLIYKLQPQVRNLGELTSLLNSINKVTTQVGDLIFDGTLSSLFNLLNNNKLKLSDIKDDRLRNTIQETIDEERKGVRLRINNNRWSRIALVSKAMFVGLHLYTGILQATSNSKGVIDTFEKLNANDFPVFDEDIRYLPEESQMRLTTINSIWVSLASIKPWNRRFQKDMNQFFINELVLSYDTKTPIGQVFDQLQPHIDTLATKYFPGFHKEDHSACIAVRQAALFVVFNTMNVLKKENRHKDFRVDGIFYKWIEYIYDEKGPLQKWFIEYVNKEMDPRIEFIQYLFKESIYFEFDEQMVELFKDLIHDKTRVERTIYYLPVFESFRVANPVLLPLYKKIIVIFHDKQIDTEIKNLILRNIVMNVQKLVTYKPSPSENTEDLAMFIHEKEMKELLFLILFEIMKPLLKSLTGRITSLEDIHGVVNSQFFLTVLKYDSTKNSSFLGYMKSMLPLNLHTDMREKKIDMDSISIDGITDISDLNFDIERKVQDDFIKEELFRFLEKLPDKEREAVLLAYNDNKNLSESERKAKSRAFQKLKEIPELQKLL